MTCNGVDNGLQTLSTKPASYDSLEWSSYRSFKILSIWTYLFLISLSWDIFEKSLLTTNLQRSLLIFPLNGLYIQVHSIKRFSATWTYLFLISLWPVTLFRNACRPSRRSSRKMGSKLLENHRFGGKARRKQGYNIFSCDAHGMGRKENMWLKLIKMTWNLMILMSEPTWCFAPCRVLVNFQKLQTSET